MIDVLLLADVFENFRATASNIHKLDPAQYVSAPSFSWDAMLKYTKVQLELLTDVNQLMFVEKGKENVYLPNAMPQLMKVKKRKSFSKMWWNFALVL